MNEADVLAIVRELWGDIRTQEAITEAWEKTVAERHPRLVDFARAFTDRVEEGG